MIVAVFAQTAREELAVPACLRVRAHTHTHARAGTVATVSLVVDPPTYAGLPRLLLTHVHWLVAN